MPYKMFCDWCGLETSRNFVSDRAIITFGDWKAEIILAHNGAWNSGMLCQNCLHWLLKEGVVNAKDEKSLEDWNKEMHEYLEREDNV